MYQRRTLRKMKPVQRRLAIQYNEIERVQRRLRRLVEEVAGVEQEVLLWEAADNNDRDNLVGMLRLPCPDCGQPIDQLGGLFCPSCTSTLDLLALWKEGGR